MKESYLVELVEQRLRQLYFKGTEKDLFAWYCDSQRSLKEQYAFLNVLAVSEELRDLQMQSQIQKIEMSNWPCDPKLQQFFHNYEPRMVSIEDLDRYLQSQSVFTQQNAASVQSTDGLRFFVYTPTADAAQLQKLPCFEDGIFQHTSRTNNLACSNLASLTDPIHLFDHCTQESALQKSCPILALARYRYWTTHCQDESFLRNWGMTASPLNSRERSITVYGRTYQFDDIFLVTNGYLIPKQHRVNIAVEFVKQYRKRLLINWEETHNVQTGKRIVQVLTTALAIGCSSQWNTADDRCMNVLCYEILKIMYEIIAKIAILEAQKTPDCRVPLVLTLVGGGIFQNSLQEAVLPAIEHAISIVQAANVTIDIGVCVHTPEEAKLIMPVLQQSMAKKAVYCLTWDDLQSGKTLTDIITRKKEKVAATIPQTLNAPALPHEAEQLFGHSSRLFTERPVAAAMPNVPKPFDSLLQCAKSDKNASNPPPSNPNQVVSCETSLKRCVRTVSKSIKCLMDHPSFFTSSTKMTPAEMEILEKKLAKLPVVSEKPVDASGALLKAYNLKMREPVELLTDDFTFSDALHHLMCTLSKTPTENMSKISRIISWVFAQFDTNILCSTLLSALSIKAKTICALGMNALYELSHTLNFLVRVDAKTCSEQKKVSTLKAAYDVNAVILQLFEQCISIDQKHQSIKLRKQLFFGLQDDEYDKTDSNYEAWFPLAWAVIETDVFKQPAMLSWLIIKLNDIGVSVVPQNLETSTGNLFGYISMILTARHNITITDEIDILHAMLRQIQLSITSKIDAASRNCSRAETSVFTDRTTAPTIRSVTTNTLIF